MIHQAEVLGFCNEPVSLAECAGVCGAYVTATNGDVLKPWDELAIVEFDHVLPDLDRFVADLRLE